MSLKILAPSYETIVQPSSKPSVAWSLPRRILQHRNAPRLKVVYSVASFYSGILILSLHSSESSVVSQDSVALLLQLSKPLSRNNLASFDQAFFSPYFGSGHPDLGALRLIILSSINCFRALHKNGSLSRGVRPATIYPCFAAVVEDAAEINEHCHREPCK